MAGKAGTGAAKQPETAGYAEERTRQKVILTKSILTPTEASGFFVNSICNLNAQQAYNEGLVSYNIAVNTGNNEAKAADLLDGATQKIWFKGVNTRTELTSILGKTVTLHDSRAGNAVVMNEYGDQKILIKMTRDRSRHSC